MRCTEAQERAWETGGEPLPEPVREHLANCAPCRESAAGLAQLRQGFEMLGREEIPQPSIRFSERVLRRMGGLAARGAAEPLESAGRRVILATLVLVLTLLLAMIVPSSGPVRHEATLENYWSQAEAPEPSAMLVSYASDWSSVPPAPVLVRAASYNTNH